MEFSSNYVTGDSATEADMRTQHLLLSQALKRLANM